MGWLIVFGVGFWIGVLAIAALEAFLLYFLFNRLNRKTHPLDRPNSKSLDPHQSLEFSYNKQGVVWVLETNKVPKDGLEKARREQKPKKEVIEVSPVKKHAKIKDHFLILKDSDGSNTSIKLKGCSIEAVSASNLPSRKWAKRFPLKLENKVSAIYKESKTLYIYLETSWEKESWSKALRLASCEDKKQLEWFAKLQKDFRGYLTSLNAGYPSFMKPSVGFYGAEPVDRSQRIDGSSKVRMLWKKITKKASLGRDERKVGEKYRSGTSSMKTTPPVDAIKSSVENNLATPSSSSTHSSSQSQISEVDYDEKIGIDEGTLCWNLLISRLFFDAKRNTDIKRSLQARIQRTLSDMRTPSYIGDVICTDINLGNVPPYIHGMRVLPMDMNEVWAFEVDIEYSGGAVLGIETRLEVRELDPEKSMMNSNSASSSVEDVPSDLLEGFEYLGKQLNLAEGTIDALDHKEEGDQIPDKLKSSKSNVPASTNMPKWKSLVNSIAKQVSQVPISVAIRVTSLRGTLRLHIKPPPSDQLWFGFTSMPDIDFSLDSSFGEHKIASGQIALFLINRLKGAIQENVVLPNCESVCIPWMLAEKDDWLPRKVAPFIWLNQAPVNDPFTVSQVNDHTSEAKPKMEGNSRTSNPDKEPSNASALPSTSIIPSDRTLQELRRPLANEEPNGSVELKREETAECESVSSRSLSLSDRQTSTTEDEDGRSKRTGRKARMLDLGKKMGEKLEEKRRHIEEKSKQIVEKMRGS